MWRNRARRQGNKAGRRCEFPQEAVTCPLYAAHSPGSGTGPRGGRWRGMDQDMRSLGLFVGALVVIGAAIFILSGGNLGGKTTVASDRDLPPVASLDRPN